MYKIIRNFAFAAILIIMAACSANTGELTLNYEQYTLDNGLKVILHEDHSDPIVAVAIQYHVGSGREKPGKTGFAHFFEHMLFQRSENLPRNAFFQKIAEMGGTFNGSTNGDGTNYFETVPRDALEKVLWMESDRMGFFINTVTQGGLEREIDIVSNEKRQNYDTQPYGQTSVIMAQELFPQGHPYSWTTIGEIDDLRGATIDDVKEFYATFYVPSNATLVIAGDFDPAETKQLVEKYFGEIAKGNPVAKPEPQPVTLAGVKKVMWEDDFARLPQLTMTFPTVEQYHKDANAISLFTSLLGGGKKSPLYKILVEEKKLAPSVSAGNMTREVAGNAVITVRAFDRVNLNDVYAAINEAFERFETEGVDEQELQTLKIRQEVMGYNRLAGIQGKALMMARDNEFGGTPTKSLEQLKELQKVTKEEIMEVYQRYFKGKPHLLISVFPKGQSNLAIEGSVMAVVSTEKVDEIESKSQAGALIDDPYERTPSSFDRSVEPPYMSNTPEITVPQIWNYSASNGMKIYGISHNELPMIQARITIPGGILLDPEDKIGLNYITARLMNEGTEFKTPEELETALGLLGAGVSVFSGTESMGISISALTKNFADVMTIAEEIILHPRFDEEALARIKAQIKSQIRQSAANANSRAQSAKDRLLYGEDGIFAFDNYGTVETVDAITMDDIKAHYKAYFSPANASLNIAGDINKIDCEKYFTSLNNNWARVDVTIPAPKEGVPAAPNKIYFVDQPGATQSVVLIAKKGMQMSDPNYYPAVIANYKLGSGSSGYLFEVLRLQRGYTYGAYSSFSPGLYYNGFSASSSVQGSTTKEAVELFKDILTNWGTDYTQELLDVTKNSMLRAMAGSFESINALVGMLGNISTYNLPFDYVKQNEKILNEITLEQVKQIIETEMNVKDMVFVIVGDARTQMKPLETLGLGKPIQIK